MARSVGLITPSYFGDLERFSLLCDSIDRRVSGYERHYVIVSDDDMPLFRRFGGARRIVLPSSRFLPRWLRLAPWVRLANGRKIWWSFRDRPVHGWHVQQMLKIAASMEMPEQRFFLVDSDIVFFRPFDIGDFAGGDRAPFFVQRGAIGLDAPLHVAWARNCDRLLGHPATAFPRDDFIGPLIVWDKDAVRGMTQAIEGATGLSWPHALCKARAFSEYLLYGHFVENSPERRAEHEATSDSLAVTHWDENPLDAAAVAKMIAGAKKSKVALCIQSLSHTPVAMIRAAAGLGAQAPGGGAAGLSQVA